VAEHPQVPQYRQELAMTHNNLGLLLQATGRVAEAEKAYRQALQLYERLVAEHPQVPQYRQELAMTHNNLGVLLKATGRADEAEKAHRQALQLRERLVAEHPQVVGYKVDLGRILARSGYSLRNSRKNRGRPWGNTYSVREKFYARSWITIPIWPNRKNF
jgi:tetratricopeptide (TPR) repeat protein